MRRRSLIPLCALLTLPSLAAAADPGRLQLPDFSALASRATQSVRITLDPALLRRARGIVKARRGAHGAAVEDLMKGVRGVYVRSYTFAAPGEYSRSDIRAVRSQLLAPGWQPIVSTHGRKQQNHVDIYVRRNGGRTEGLAIIAAAPRQLTIINIVGPIDLASVARLQGQFGLPDLGIPGGGRTGSGPALARTRVASAQGSR